MWRVDAVASAVRLSRGSTACQPRDMHPRASRVSCRCAVPDDGAVPDERFVECMSMRCEPRLTVRVRSKVVNFLSHAR